MKKNLCLALTTALVLTTACSENADSSVSDLANKAVNTVVETTESAKNVVDTAASSTTNITKKVVDEVASAADSLTPELPSVEELKSIPVEGVKKAIADSADDIISQEEEILQEEIAQASMANQEAMPSSTNFVAGQHYVALAEPIAVKSDDIQVSELFWYGCGHCFNLEPHMKSYRANLPEGAEFVEVPAIFGNQWKFHAQVFYTAQALGIQKDTHEEIFNMLHVKKQRITNLKDVQKLFAKFGQDAKAVESAFKSFSVDSNLRNAALFARKSGATSVPTIESLS